MRSTHRRCGFTIVELLVVITVIVILAATLFPAFAQAREKARQSVCLSNLKQIGAATMLYLQDYGDSFPGPGLLDFWIPGPEGRWDSLAVRADGAPLSLSFRLQPYVNNTPVFLCPSNPTGRDLGGLLSAGKETWDTRFVRKTYGWNIALSNGWSWPGWPNGRQAPDPWRPLALAEISRPVLLPMASDDLGFAHSRLLPAEARKNICFTDGHAKFSRVLDYWLPPSRQPAQWDLYNPRQPVDVEKPCSPTCAEEAARD